MLHILKYTCCSSYWLYKQGTHIQNAVNHTEKSAFDRTSVFFKLTKVNDISGDLLTKVGDASIAFPDLFPAKFIKRDNRFRVKIQLGNKTSSAHLANPGRLRELLIPGADIWVSKAKNPNRRTAFSLELVKSQDTLVSINSQVPNALVNNALLNHTLPNLAEYTIHLREKTLGHSRIDFCISHNTTFTWLEVKSVTLVKNGTAAFPDAPTLRGQRHLFELTTAVQNGDKSMVIFVVQRDDAKAFRPNDETDPEFGKILRQADSVGVSIMAIDCKVTLEQITLIHTLPVLL